MAFSNQKKKNQQEKNQKERNQLPRNGREVYELLCRIDKDYEPTAAETALLESFDMLYCNQGFYSSLKAYQDGSRELDWRDLDLSALPESIGRLTGLRGVDLLGSKISALPESFGQLTKLQTLDLSRTRITTLRSSFGQLTNLQELDLFGTRITALPESLGQLKNLQTLGLSHSRITALPESFGQLTNLQELSLAGTRITALPESFGQLTKLQKLFLGNTQITTLPEYLGQLTKLQELSLIGTQITSLPESFGQLTNLQTLYLNGTQITALPECLGNLPKLEKLDLSWLTLPGIPKSLALRGLPFVEKEYLYQYVRGINLWGVTLTEQDRSVFLETPELIKGLYAGEEQLPLRECRVLFLGDGGSGKTYTLRRIQNDCKKAPEGAPYETEETPGVEITDYEAEAAGRSLSVHFWDFGGQAILHSMHRCFLADKSCYVITVRTRDTDNTPRARYWLRNVTAIAPNSPILLYVNCWGHNDGKRAIDESMLRQDYPNIKDVVYVSAKEAADGDFREKLLDRITAMAAGSELLQQTGNRRWEGVRNSIIEESTTRHYLTKERYRQLCREHKVTDREASDLLTRFNILGVCFSYHRDRMTREFADYMLLDPVWLTNAVYAVIEEGMIHAQEGRINLTSIQNLLGNRAPGSLVYLDEAGNEKTRPYQRTRPELVYSPTECRYVLDVAAAHNLCYRVDERTLFFPALCKNDTPKEAMGSQEGFPVHIQYQFRYGYLPDSLLHRLMIRCMEKGFALRRTWLHGMILDLVDTHRAILHMKDDETLTVDIWHREGFPAYTFFRMLREEILDIGRSLNLAVREEWIADGADRFQVIALLQSWRHKQTVIFGTVPGKAYSVYELLNRFYDPWTIHKMDFDKGLLLVRPDEYHRCGKENPALRRAVWEAYQKKCVYCGLPISPSELQIDHVLASKRKLPKDAGTSTYLAELARRGFDLEHPDLIENYVPACGPCNRLKSNETWTVESLRFFHETALAHRDRVLELMAKYDADFVWNAADETPSPAVWDGREP